MRLALLLLALTSVACHRPWLNEPAPPPPPPSAGTHPWPASQGARPAAAAPGAVAAVSGPYAPASYQPGPGPATASTSVGGEPSSGQPAPLVLGSGAARAAQALEGKPYCWGGTGPECYDCSGLTTAAWATQGIVLPRTSDAQRRELRPVHWSEVQPGDILWRPGHVGLYVERGWAIHAPGEGKAVQYQPAETYEVALRPY